MQRSDLNFFEEAAAIYALMQDRSMTQEETARRLGMSQPSLANKIRLLRLSGEEQRMVLENHLTERHARALLRMEDPEKRMAALKTVIARKNERGADGYVYQITFGAGGTGEKAEEDIHCERCSPVPQHDRPCCPNHERGRHRRSFSA